MRPSDAVRRTAAGLLLLIATGAAPGWTAASDDLATVRQEAIAAAREAQQREVAVAALDHEIDLFGRDAAARRRGLDESRVEQVRLLGTLLHLARAPASASLAINVSPIDRLRGEMLMQTAEPALRAQARALSAEIARLAALRQRIAAKGDEASAAREALVAGRERVAAAVAHRTALVRAMVPEDTGAAARLARIAGTARDFAELVKSAAGAADRRDKEIQASARPAQPKQNNPPGAEMADPTRPVDPRSLVGPAGIQQPAVSPQPALVAPAAGRIISRAGAPSDGLDLHPIAGATIVAPFDGRVVYAGPFRDSGLVLIIRHDHLYHSLLAGLGRVDANVDEWVLAGEPIGAMPDSSPPRSSADAGRDAKAEPGGLLHFELRRDGRPVGPQPWLVNAGGGHDERDRDQRVRE